MLHNDIKKSEKELWIKRPEKFMCNITNDVFAYTSDYRHFIMITNATNGKSEVEMVGMLTCFDHPEYKNTISILTGFLTKNFIGKGLMGELYKKIAQNGHVLFSSDHSNGAKKVWQKLIREGNDVWSLKNGVKCPVSLVDDDIIVDGESIYDSNCNLFLGDYQLIK